MSRGYCKSKTRLNVSHPFILKPHHFIKMKNQTGTLRQTQDCDGLPLCDDVMLARSDPSGMRSLCRGGRVREEDEEEETIR